MSLSMINRKKKKAVGLLSWQYFDNFDGILVFSLHFVPLLCCCVDILGLTKRLNVQINEKHVTIKS